MTRGPVWFATPSLQQTFTLTILSAYRGALPIYAQLLFETFKICGICGWPSCQPRQIARECPIIGCYLDLCPKWITVHICFRAISIL